MKNLIVPVLLCVAMCACEQKAVVQSEPVVLPVEFLYKGDFVMGKMQDVKTVMECSKRIGSLDPNVGEFIADSLLWQMADGTVINASRDSVIKVIAQLTSMISSMKVDYMTAIPVTNTTAHEDWVLSWTDETYNYKDGKSERAQFMETIKMKDGKLREVYQYTRKMANAAEPAANK